MRSYTKCLSEPFFVVIKLYAGSLYLFDLYIHIFESSCRFQCQFHYNTISFNKCYMRRHHLYFFVSSFIISREVTMKYRFGFAVLVSASSHILSIYLYYYIFLTATMSKLDRTCYILLVTIHQMCHLYSGFYFPWVKNELHQQQHQLNHIRAEPNFSVCKLNHLTLIFLIDSITNVYGLIVFSLSLSFFTPVLHILPHPNIRSLL